MILLLGPGALAGLGLQRAQGVGACYQTGTGSGGARLNPAANLEDSEVPPGPACRPSRGSPPGKSPESGGLKARALTEQSTQQQGRI